MVVTVVHRPWSPRFAGARRGQPTGVTTLPSSGPHDDGGLRLPDLPETPTGDPGGLVVTLLPALGALGSVGLLVSMGGAGSGRAYVAAGLVVLATLGFVGVQVDRQRRQRGTGREDVRATYLHRLAALRRAAQEAADRQRRAALALHPPVEGLPSLLEGGATLRRGPGHPDLLRVRVGAAPGPADLRLAPPDEPPGPRADLVCARAAGRLLAAHRQVPGLPSVLDLAATPRLVLGGDREEALAAARALLCQAAAAHDPDDLAVAVLCDPSGLADWDWAKWLPHAGSRRQRDQVGPARAVATSADALRTLLAPSSDHRWTLLVRDRAPVPDDLLGDGRTTLVVLGGGPDVHDQEEVVLPARRADRCSTATAEAVARRLAGSSRGATDDRDPVLVALGIDAPHRLDVRRAWTPRPDRDRLRVPVGTTEAGDLLHLDLKESARGGVGPHGLVVGATGSGKSELLRTLVLGLAATHSPRELNTVLVDFKGGATFAGLSRLPHTSAVITNLAQDLSLVDRMHDALTGELVRRQQLLRSAGDVASVHDLDRLRAGGADVPDLPSLLVVVDEFSELLTARPALVDLFVAVGRLGRSLGLHLLLASQRLEEGRLRGLEAHLSYRVALRTFSAQESRAVLGVPDAHDLPPVPGTGLVRTGPGDPTRFRAGLVTRPAPPTAAPVTRTRSPSTAGTVLPFTLTPLPGAAPVTARRAASGVPTGTPARSLLDVVVDRLAGHGPAAHPVWLPPLEVPPTLGDLLGDVREVPGLGLVSAGWRARPGLQVPVGVLDLPREQRREPLVLDLSGAGAHLAVVGAPRSGRTTLLRSLVLAAALVRTPRELRCHVLDLAGGGWSVLADLPHVASVVGRDRPDAARRVVAEVAATVAARESGTGAGAEGLGGSEGRPDVVVVVDGWGTLRSELEDLEPRLQDLAARGAAHGVHLLVAAGRWAEVRPATRDVLTTRLELRLGDPLESEVDRRTAAAVPVGRPGRGLVADGTHLLGALPRLDGSPEPATAAAGLRDLVAAVASAWSGPPTPRLRELPDRVPLAEVRRCAAAGGSGVPPAHPLLGLDDESLSAVALDPGREAHLLVLGDPGSGRTTTLRSLAHEVARTRTPEQARLVVVDPRRALLGDLPGDHLLQHLGATPGSAAAVQDLVGYLHRRLPGPGVTPRQLRDRSWWQGAEVVVLVDDQDLVAAEVLAPLAPLLPHARDVGLRLVVARRVGGAARALHEPVLQPLRDLGAPALLLSGPPDEGPLVGGIRAAPLPPGRGRLVLRGRPARLVQVAWTEPDA